MNEITTVEELDALPVGSILRDSRGEPVWRSERWGWRAGNGVRDVEPKLVIEDGAPLTLLHPLPDAPAPSAEGREALAGVIALAMADDDLSFVGVEHEDAADAALAWFAARQPAPTVSAETMGALDELCRLDDEFGMEPSDVRWVRERAQAIRAALAVTP